MENIMASISMLDAMVTDFKIQNFIKVLDSQKVNVKFQISYGMPDELHIEQDINKFEIGLRVNVIVELEDSLEQITNIESEIKGIFEVNSKDNKQIIDMLKYNGLPLLYQELRAYITSVTALSHNKSIILPMINFVAFFENENNDNR